MLGALPADALPYCGPAPMAGAIWQSWNLDPVLIAVLALTVFLWERNNQGTPAQRNAFRAGMTILAIAFISPLCALSSGLFAVRSLHHIVLVAIVAPLLGYAVRGRGLPGAGAAVVLHSLVFWFWHLPAAYGAALSSDLVYWLMQLSLLGSGVVFWSALYRSRALSGEVAALAMVMTQMGLLGALLTFAPDALYAPHFFTTALYGLSPLQDQQLAGLIMWVASVPLYGIAALPLLRRWFAQVQEAAA